MSLINPGADSGHIIKKAMNSKSLATLAKEEDAYVKLKESEKEPPKQSPYANRPQRPPKKIFYSKDDLEAYKKSIIGKSNDEIFDSLGIKVTYKEDGTKKISRYSWPFVSFSFDTAGIDEEELLKGVTEIEGNCSLSRSNLKTLGSVRKIGRNLTIPLFTKIEDLSNIESIGGNINCYVENPQDAIDLIKKLNLNPSKIGGYIYTGDGQLAFNSYCLYDLQPRNIEEAIQILQKAQANINYEKISRD